VRKPSQLLKSQEKVSTGDTLHEANHDPE
jgi:hypothetical protein